MYHLTKLFRYSSWLILCYRGNPLQSIRLCPFCVNEHAQLDRLCHIIQSNMLNVYHSPAHLFFSFYLSLPTQCWLQRLSQLWQYPVPLQLPLPGVNITIDTTPNHWTFCFCSSGFPISCSGTWSGYMCRVRIVLQELHAVKLMLYKMGFWLSSKVVALHLDNNTAKVYFFNQDGTASLLSRLPCHILNLPN